MTKGEPKDIAASVRARLQERAKQSHRPFAELLQYFAMERFLYRLAQSPHVDKFVLKGALMLVAWKTPDFRPTKDIDFLARMPNDVESVVSVFRDACGQPVEEDGLNFDATSIKGKVIKEDAEYEGVRVTFLGLLQKSRISMQIDVGFGDVIVPEAALHEYPTILNFEAPRLLSYSRETAIAEKFQAMVKLEELNSRMKDFFDIWLLSRQFDFDGAMLSEAVRQTFANRDTRVTSSPVAWTSAFTEDPAKQTQWAGFLRKSRLEGSPATLAEVVKAIADFLRPVAAAVESGTAFRNLWKAPGTWI